MRDHARLTAQVPELVRNPWRHPFVFLHAYRCGTCRELLRRLRAADKLLAFVARRDRR